MSLNGIIAASLPFVVFGSDLPHASAPQGLGRVATLACILGCLWGIHATIAVLILFSQNGFIELTLLRSPDRIQLLLQWCLYVVTLCTFHLLEFFVTVIYNPYVTSADSFLVNHSTAYTAAALVCLAVHACDHPASRRALTVFLFS